MIDGTIVLDYFIKQLIIIGTVVVLLMSFNFLLGLIDDFLENRYNYRVSEVKKLSSILQENKDLSEKEFNKITDRIKTNNKSISDYKKRGRRIIRLESLLELLFSIPTLILIYTTIRIFFIIVLYKG